jgi:hypothetical protein
MINIFNHKSGKELTPLQSFIIKVLWALENGGIKLFAFLIELIRFVVILTIVAICVNMAYKWLITLFF